MIIKVFILLSTSFWLSCGSSSDIVKNKVSEKQAEAATDVNISATTVLKDTTKVVEVVILSEEIQEPIQKLSKEAEDSSQELIKKQNVPQKTEQSKALEVTTHKEPAKKVVVKPDHSLWSKLLAKHVNSAGDVAYKNFLQDKDKLQAYLNQLAKNSPEKTWSKNEKLAYYINLYNAATVKLILDNYPTKSIKDIKSPWGKKWIKTGDGLLSLGGIEHKILRKMNEPRIHFAINCASYSCPKLINSAFTASQMEVQLQQATTDFINDKTRNKITAEKLHLSNIFKWYKKDFTKNGSLIDYIKPYINIEINADVDIDYLKYNWSLNEAK